MGKKIIQGELEVTGQVTIPETPTADASAASKKYTDTQLALKENLSNKVQELSNASTTAQYPSAKTVYDLSVDLREVAEGKCKSFILSYNDTLSSVKTNLQTYGHTCSDATGNDITADVLAGDYDDAEFINSSFNSNSDEILFQADSILIFRAISSKPSDASFIFVKSNYDGYKMGDIVLVIETQVPDRWYDGNGSFQKLETSKIDLTSYATIAYVNEKITGVYSASATYAVGDLVIYQNALYRCITAVSTAESFDSNKWTNTDIAGAFVNKYNAVVSSSVLPDTTGSYDIGDSTHAFNDVYTKNIRFSTNPASNYILVDSYQMIIRAGGNAIRAQGDIRPYDNNLFSLGSSSYAWKDLYLSNSIKFGNSSITQDSSNRLEIFGYNGLILNTNGNPIQLNRNITFSSDNSKDIGNSTRRIKDLYLAGNLSDGTNSIAVADIQEKISIKKFI